MQHSVQAGSPGTLEVNAQLELILRSREFNSSKKLKDFLIYVVEENLAGRGEQIKAYNIALDVFNLGKNFDPSLNTVVRVTAGRVRNKLERYYLTTGAQDKIHIEIPRGTYLPVIRYLSPKLKQKSHEAQDEARAPAPLDHDVRAPSAKTQQHRPTIMVLPFSNMSDVEALAPFLCGLAEEIAMALNRYDEFVVFTPQGADPLTMDVWDLAKKMDARFIINGSAQLSDNLLRLRVTLTDSKSRFHVWSDKFNSSFAPASFFSIQDEITSLVVARIADSFNFIHRMQLKNELGENAPGLEVHEAMLFYHYWLISLTPQHFIKAKEALQTAIALEPASASLKGMLSDVYASHCQWGLEILHDALNLSRQLAEEALCLDNSCQYANWAAAYNYFLRRDEQNFLVYVQKALALNPSNTNIMSAAGVKLIMLGQSDEGLAMLQTALHLNPHIPGWQRLGPFTVSYLAGNYEAALSEAKHIITADFLWGPLARAAALGRLGRKEEGNKELIRVLKIMPEFRKTSRATMLKLFFQEESVNKITEGLRMSGL